MWQRQWTPAVVDAVEQAPFEQLMVLSAEISWDGETAVTHTVALPNLADGAGLVVRVGVPPEGAAVATTLAEVVAHVLVDHPGAAGVQLDIDLPTRRLGEYPPWLEALRPVVGPRWLEVTTLPTWLGSPALTALAETADRTVLQVHWLDPHAPDRLLDPHAVRHIEEMALLRRSFRVGLPAYGYDLVLDEDGVVKAVSAEQGRIALSRGTRTRSLWADPAEVAALVAGLLADRPPELAGLVWFRLPTAQDRLSWPAPTLAAVREGRVPVAVPSVELTREADSGVLNVVVYNHGEAVLPLPTVQLDRSVVLADGVGDYTWAAATTRFEPHPSGSPLRPGASRTVGWLRPDKDPPYVTLVPAPLRLDHDAVPPRSGVRPVLR